MLYFVVALLDKWVILIDGGQLVGLSSGNVNLTLPVGFGLIYYLIGAVLLDFNAEKLNKVAVKNIEPVIETEKDIGHAIRVKDEYRRNLYWRTLAHYLTWHVFGLATTTILLWVFFSVPQKEQNTEDQVQNPNDGSDIQPYSGTLIYLSYVLAYTGKSPSITPRIDLLILTL